MATPERVYAEAEERLGRKLSSGERRIDIVGYDRDLARGKKRLHSAIEKEKARVIALKLRGKYARMKVTPEMVEALAYLHRRGRAHAHAELRRAGIEPGRRMASRGEIAALRSVLALLRTLVGGLSRRVDLEVKLRLAREKRIGVEIGAAAYRSLAKAMEKRVPGSLAIAADLVSSAIAGGLEEGFSHDADLFEWWEYSAVMDGGTCSVCADFDGTRYPSWAAIMRVLPNGGPNPLCLGNGRCRCRPVPGDVKLPEL